MEKNHMIIDHFFIRVDHSPQQARRSHKAHPPTTGFLGTPLFVTYDELYSPNHSSFHILMFTTRGQSEPQQYIQSPSFTMTEGTAAWKAIDRRDAI